MKIWAQSASGLTREASIAGYGSQYEISLKKHFQKVARPGTTVEIHGVEGSPPGKDRFRSATHLVLTGIIKSVLRAEKEGYDAIAVVNTLDHGYYEIRELVSLPVVFATESSLHLACMLAPRFAFIGHNQQILLRVSALAKAYGLSERMAPGGCLNLTYEDFPRMYADPKPYVERFIEEARRVIRQGADILMFQGNPPNMFMVDQGITEIDGVPILDPCAAVIKTAEMMVDLKQIGIDRTRSGLFSRVSKEELAELSRLYSADA